MTQSLNRLCTRYEEVYGGTKIFMCRKIEIKRTISFLIILFLKLKLL
jgi:hypothetical protein